MSSPRTGILFLIRFDSEQDQDVQDGVVAQLILVSSQVLWVLTFDFGLGLDNKKINIQSSLIKQLQY